MPDCPLCRGSGKVIPTDNSVTIRMLQLMMAVLDKHVVDLIKEEQAKT